MKDLLKKGAAALHIRNNIISYFNEPTDFEMTQLRKRQEAREFEKRKSEALMSQPVLSKTFNPNELANLDYEQI